MSKAMTLDRETRRWPGPGRGHEYLQVDVEHTLGDLSLRVVVRPVSALDGALRPVGRGQDFPAARPWWFDPAGPRPGGIARANAGGDGERSLGTSRGTAIGFVTQRPTFFPT